jgi:hypothetical protein
MRCYRGCGQSCKIALPESRVIDLKAEDLHLHPRIEQQGVSPALVSSALTAALPRLVPFRGRAVHSTVALIDWDHRLPSKALTLRLHVLYETDARERFHQAFALRKQEIAARDRFPEFDVPDFAGLPSDEAYDVELGADLTVEAMRLVSPWRREIAGDDADRAVESVRTSRQFAEVCRQLEARSPSLGDLEAVAWTPPCESNLPAWTLDVWWLTSFDGRIGRGWSFLVDVAADGRPVVASREFSIRAG